MRKERTRNEAYFGMLAKEFIEAIYCAPAIVDQSYVDQPDFVFMIGSKRIAVELTQIPDNYIIRKFMSMQGVRLHRQSSLLAQLLIIPFEPHNWVHEALLKKARRKAAYLAHAKADEVWCVVHPPGHQSNWPFSEGSWEEVRAVERRLLLFGARALLGSFDRLLFVYVDGEVLDLTSQLESAPSEIGIDPKNGYPALTVHRIRVNIPRSKVERIVTDLVIEGSSFRERIVHPRDSSYLSIHPNIERPDFFIKADFSAERMSIDIRRGGTKESTVELTPSKYEENAVGVTILSKKGLLPTRFKTK